MSLQNSETLNKNIYSTINFEHQESINSDKDIHKCVFMSKTIPTDTKDSQEKTNYVFPNLNHDLDNIPISLIQSELYYAKRMLKYISKMYRWIGTKLAYIQRTHQAYNEIKSKAHESNANENSQNKVQMVTSPNQSQIFQKLDERIPMTTKDTDNSIHKASEGLTIKDILVQSPEDSNKPKGEQAFQGDTTAFKQSTNNQTIAKGAKKKKKKRKMFEIEDKTTFLLRSDLKLDANDIFIGEQILIIKKYIKEFVLSEDEVLNIVEDVNKDEHLEWTEVGDTLSSRLMWDNQEKLNRPSVDFDPLIWTQESEENIDKWAKSKLN